MPELEINYLLFTVYCLLFSFLKFTKFNPAYRPLDSTVTEDAGIDPITVATFELAFTQALTTQLDLIHKNLTSLHGESCSCLTHDLYTATHNQYTPAPGGGRAGARGPLPLLYPPYDI